MPVLVPKFFLHLFKTNKALFALILIFVCAQWYFSAHSRQNFPIINWGMFSSADTTQKIFTEYLIEIDQQPLLWNTLSPWEAAIVQSKISYYQKWLNNGKQDYWKPYLQAEYAVFRSKAFIKYAEQTICNNADADLKFKSWLHRYLSYYGSSNTFRKVHVYQLAFVFDHSKCKIVKKDLLW